jgi:hypothetical protein
VLPSSTNQPHIVWSVAGFQVCRRLRLTRGAAMLVVREKTRGSRQNAAFDSPELGVSATR